MISGASEEELTEAIGRADVLLEVMSKIKQLQKENKQLKDNWNKLREFIVKEYYMYLPLEVSTKSITILIDKMQELEQGSDNQC